MLCVPGEAWGNNHIVDSGANDSVTIKRISRSRVDAGIDLIPDNKKFQPNHCTPEELKRYQARVLRRIAKTISPDLQERKF